MRVRRPTAPTGALSLSHVGEEIFAELINRRPESFLQVCGLVREADLDFMRQAPVALCEVPFAQVDGKSFDGACRVDVVVRLRPDLAFPIELKLGHTRLSKQRFDREWLQFCKPSHGGRRWRGSVMAALDRRFSTPTTQELAMRVNQSVCMLTENWLLVVRRAVLDGWRENPPGLSQRGMVKSFEELVEALGGRTALNSVVRDVLGDRDFFADWGLSD